MGQLVADGIDTSFAPQLRDHVAIVPVEQEAILYEEQVGQLHQLNPTAAAVCSLFDGEVSLATLIDDLAAVFQGDATEIEADVLAMTRELGRKGLLVGVTGEAELAVGDGLAAGVGAAEAGPAGGDDGR